MAVKICANNKILFLKTDTVLIWIHILIGYGPEIDYIQGNNIMVTHLIYLLSIIWKQKTIQESNYTTENVLKIYDINELPEGEFLINLKTNCYYQ